MITVSMAASCSANQPKYHAGGPYYYKSWASYFLPYRPVDEISRPDAEGLERQGFAYYIAFFDEQGLIKSFEKRYQGKMEFKVTYYYENGILKKEESLDANGKVKITLYDKNGERMKP
jgi:hypothetical protein